MLHKVNNQLWIHPNNVSHVRRVGNEPGPYTYEVCMNNNQAVKLESHEFDTLQEVMLKSKNKQRSVMTTSTETEY